MFEALKRVCMYVWSPEAHMYVCLKHTIRNIHTVSWCICKKFCMLDLYVSKPCVLSYLLPIQLNGTHPTPWLLEDPQKVIHIDTILILVYIHTQVSPVALIYYSSSAHARHTISGSPSVRLDLGMYVACCVCMSAQDLPHTYKLARLCTVCCAWVEVCQY